MDLDLRRYGNKLYSKAEQSGGSGGDDSSGDSTEIDYEAIYQFYKNQIISYLPEEEIENYIIPEHYADVEIGVGTSQEYIGKNGIWKISGGSAPGKTLFDDLNNFTNEPTTIYIGLYQQPVPGPS